MLAVSSQKMKQFQSNISLITPYEIFKANNKTSLCGITVQFGLG